MPVFDESPVSTRRFDALPLTTPTEAALEVEASLLGDSFVEVSGHPADLIADAEEMLLARSDAAELSKRGYQVSDGQFERVALLVRMLRPLSALQTRQVEASKVKTQEAEVARKRLIELRSAVASLGKAAGLPTGLFALELTGSVRLNVLMMRMEEVLQNVQAYWNQLPDQARLTAMVAEARTLIDQQKELRQSARLLRADRSIEGRKAARLERLLLNALQYLSAQGLAAFPGDAVREPRYRLDQLYGRRASKVQDPGAGGPDGVPSA